MSKLIRYFLILFLANAATAQRFMEDLDRGLIAMRTGTNSVLISWRIPGDEYAENATYNIYRGTTLLASNLNVSNYTDATSTDFNYRVAAVIGGVEQTLSDAVGIRGHEYFTIPVRPINGSFADYNLNDASVGDLDGDGEYEIVVKRLANDATPAATNYHYLEAYKLDGTFLWAINLGPNLINTVEVNFLVYDLDNDGKAEIATRTSDGMIDGLGNDIGDRDGDGKINYRSTAALNSSYYRVDGPDYISIFDGETGKEIAWDWYIDREPIAQWGLPGQNLSQLGHRSTKCMWAVAYTDGVRPSFIISRGIYERIKLEAWNFRDGKLTKEWAFDSSPNGVATAYHGQGNHNLAAGDVDGDGRDELTYGAMAVDEYGKGLYSTTFGHGDAGHLADINPDLPGLEFFSCQEHANGTTIPGVSIRNAATGTIQWQNLSSGDIGRSMAADIDPNYYGMEVWGSDGSGLRSCTGELISWTVPTSVGGGASYNFGVWWDGDVQREILDRSVIGKWNGTGTSRVATLYNITAISDNNGTKSNPCLMADILGDWREEIIYRKSDNSGMIVFVTPFSTEQRMYTLMHDPNYRSAIAWQNNSYNQPPNLGFYFGGGMSTPPNPDIRIYKACLNNRKSIPYGKYTGFDLFQKELLNDISDLDLPRSTSLVVFEEDDFKGAAEIIRGTGTCDAIIDPSLTYASMIFSKDLFIADIDYVIKSKVTEQALTVGNSKKEIISLHDRNIALSQAWQFEQTAANEYSIIAQHSNLKIQPESDLYWVQDESKEPATDEQIFQIITDHENPRYFMVKNKSNGKCFETDPENGTLLCKACDASNENQLFYEEVYSIPQTNMILGGSVQDQLNLFPNPISDHLMFKGVNVLQAHIYTMKGNLIESEPVENNQIDLSSLDAGMYLMKLETEKGEFYRKILKK